MQRKRRGLRYKGVEQPDWISTLLGALLVIMIAIPLLQVLLETLQDLLDSLLAFLR